MELSKQDCKRLAKESSMVEFETDIYEAHLDDLEKFAKLVISFRESRDN